jgi:hypothetical protein
MENQQNEQITEADDPIMQQISSLEEGLEDTYVAIARQTSCMVCNTLTALWDSGYKQSATSKMNFVKMTDPPYSAMAQAQGVSLFTIHTPDEFLDSQLPSNMILILPSSVANTVFRIVGLHRKNHLRFLKEDHDE